MKNTLTFFCCLWVTLILFGFTPNIKGLADIAKKGVKFAGTVVSSVSFEDSRDRYIPIYEDDCKEGLGPNGYEICIKNDYNYNRVARPGEL